MKHKAKIDGKQLRKARRRWGLTQQELADRTRISRSYLSELELEKKTPGLRVVESLAAVLRVPTRTIVKE